MGSRLLPLSLVAGALLADSGGHHRAAYYLVLLAVVGAAGAAFVAVADAIERKAGALLRGINTSLALVFLVVGALVRADGASMPKLATSAAVGALFARAEEERGRVVDQPVADEVVERRRRKIAQKAVSRPVDLRVPLERVVDGERRCARECSEVGVDPRECSLLGRAAAGGAARGGLVKRAATWPRAARGRSAAAPR